MSIVDPDPDSNTPPIMSLATVAEMMSNSPDTYTVNVGFLIEYIARHHELPVTCPECSEQDDRAGRSPCLMYESGLSVAFAWLLKVGR